jgi:uncharacterized protein YegP (UPF0339 family)
MKKRKLEIYKSRKNAQFYWRLVASNGKIVAIAGEGYTRKATCEKQASKHLNMNNVETVYISWQ